jgi:hypothetical protein
MEGEAGDSAAETCGAGSRGCVGELDWGMRFLGDRTASRARLRGPSFLVSIKG